MRELNLCTLEPRLFVGQRVTKAIETMITATILINIFSPVRVIDQAWQLVNQIRALLEDFEANTAV